MAEYANNHFNSYIPDKDIEEQLLTENPVPSNLQQVKPLDDFIRSFLSSETVITSDHQMERFQGKIREVMGPLDKFVTLVEQVILLLGQALLSVSYTRRLNILKMITKDPRKKKPCLTNMRIY